MKYTFPTDYRDDPYLVEIDAALVPFVSGALMKFLIREVWATESDYELGYNAFCELLEDLMGKGIARLQMEIRAARGVDELDPNYNDPLADPFTLQMGHMEKLNTTILATNGILQEIKTLIEAMNNSEDLEEIKGHAAQIALLLA